MLLPLPVASRLDVDPLKFSKASMEARQAAASRLDIDPLNYTMSLPLPVAPPPAAAPRPVNYTISLPLQAAPPPASAPRPLNYNISLPLPVALPPAATPRTRRNGRQAPRHGKPPTIPPPYPWATNHRATVHSLKHLTDAGINIISGVVQCKRCGQTFEIEYDLKTKFYAISRFVTDNKYMLRDRAPVVWMNPALPKCKLCGEDNVLKPLMAVKKKEINWLFLLLGQMLGCCTLQQLKYFCKHTKNHRTGAKDRVLFLTYLTLCKQLDPNGSYERSC